MRANPQPILFTREQLAEALGVSPRHISKMMAARQIPVIRLSPQIVRFDVERVKAALGVFEVPALGG